MAERAPVMLGLAFGFGCLLTVLIQALATPPATVNGSPETVRHDAALIEAIGELRQSVERLAAPQVGEAARLVGPAAPPGSRSPDLEPLLRELTAAIHGIQDQLSAGDGAGGTAGLVRAREQRREPDWSALQPIAEVLTRDQDLAKASLRLLTPVELLRRFGPPTNVWSQSSGALIWNYQREEQVDGDWVTQAEVNFRLQDGYVIDAWGEDRQTELALEAAGD